MSYHQSTTDFFGKYSEETLSNDGFDKEWKSLENNYEKYLIIRHYKPFLPENCCLICKNRTCNNGVFCDIMPCKKCKWYRHYFDDSNGFCFLVRQSPQRGVKIL